MYESFGNLTFSEGTPTDSNSFRYTGREFDSETGLYYYRARYYDPEVGRFMNEDPIGFSGGINFYSYVGNDPVNFNDPLGLCENRPAEEQDSCLLALLYATNKVFGTQFGPEDVEPAPTGTQRHTGSDKVFYEGGAANITLTTRHLAKPFTARQFNRIQPGRLTIAKNIFARFLGITPALEIEGENFERRNFGAQVPDNSTFPLFIRFQVNLDSPNAHRFPGILKHLGWDVFTNQGGPCPL